MTTRRIVLLGVVLALVHAKASAEDPKDTVILDTSGFWRLHYTHRPPVVKAGRGLRPIRYGVDLWLNRETAAPPVGWEGPGFDDSSWRRLPGTPFPVQRYSWLKLPDLNFGFSNLDMSAPHMAHMAMRGRFKVTDPAKVKGLALSVAYRGGVVVYVNGKEVARGDMPAGEVTVDTLAEDYPEEAFARPDGKPLVGYKEIKAHRDRVEMHNRELKDVRIPAAVLRKGVNVLAVSVHRAPYHEIVDTQQKPPAAFVVYWSTCGLLRVRLSARGASGVVPNVARPQGVQVWNSNPMSVDFDLDWGDPNEKLLPITLVGARNGAVSGKVVVGSTEAIEALSARMTDLKSSSGAAIRAADVEVRYAFPSRGERGASFRYPAVPTAFDALAEAAPAEVPVRVKRTGRGTWVLPGQPKCVYGAVQPVWVTVNIPPDAKPGDYEGALRIAAGGKRFRVPVKLRVCAWKLPDPGDFRTFTELVQSPESVARQYGVEPWSDRHLQLMARSLRLLGQIGSRTTYLPLICRTNMGNDQSMVRWRTRPPRPGSGRADGTYEHDYAPLEKYLDVVVEHQGRPKIVCVYVWDYHTNDGKVPVTGIDPEGGLTTLELPGYTDARSRSLWKPVIDGVRKRLRTRGLEKAMMFALAGDRLPRPEIVTLFKELSPETPWAIVNHQSASRTFEKYATIGYKVDVWSTRFGADPEEGRRHGWNLPRLKVHFGRNIRDDFHLQTYRFLAPMNIMGESRGFARQGADFWAVLKGKKGRLTGTLSLRYTSRRNLDIRASVLAPGRRGAVATHRFEMIREGIQVSEARIFIEKALAEKKITGPLARRCQDVLDECSRAMLRGAASLVLSQGTWRAHPVNPHQWWQTPSEVGYQWYVSSGWQRRSGKLFSAAAEVAERLGTK